MQSLVQPLVVSWGYEPDPSFSTGSRYIDLLQWVGTIEPSAALSIPAAIQFMQEHNWDCVRQECGLLLNQALQRIAALTGLPGAYPEDPALSPHPLPPQLGIARLPPGADLAVLKTRLYDEYQVEVPLVDWNGQHFVRLSVQAYNTQADIDALVEALTEIV